MKYFAFLYMFILFVSCSGQEQKTQTVTAVADRTIGPKPFDRYFVETTDTFPKNGAYTITRNILQDKKGVYWFATWQGIISYDGMIYTNHTLKNDLVHFHMFSILETKNGDLWFGSIGGGVYKYDGKTWTLFTTNEGLADNMVCSMTEDKNGNVWIGTDNGVSKYNGKTFTNYTNKNGLSETSVNSVMCDSKGNIWIGAWQGVCCYNGKTFKSITYKDSLFVNVRSVIEDKKGNIWIGSRDGLFCYNPVKITKKADNFIGYIYEDKEERLWLAAGEPSVKDGTWSHRSNNMVLYYYDGKTFKTIIYKPQVFGIMEDSKGIIWFGTPDGEHTFDPKSFGNER